PIPVRGDAIVKWFRFLLATKILNVSIPFRGDVIVKVPFNYHLIFLKVGFHPLSGRCDRKEGGGKFL
ncbi:hypothetical protein, partial [Nostoc sp. KVJ20]|uniref:hypothetical protein n=1 Tax=Nostoc sp. KVJ20 TaxID=457944 RepID=UPI001C402EFF